MAGHYDKRNRLNNLTGRDWLLLTKSFWNSEKCGDDKDAMKHPAPFLIKDIMRLISLFTKKDMVVLDPFVGSGTSLIAAGLLDRFGIGIDLNTKYKSLAKQRLKKQQLKDKEDYVYLIGDSNVIVPQLDPIDYIITSPPYHNILRNKGEGLRATKDNSYRKGARSGVEYYSDHKNDLGNKKDYDDFILSLKEIMSKCHSKLNSRKYCSIIISDFTVNKKEMCVQGDIVNMMREIGFDFCGTIVLLQNNKPLYPFGYPYAFKINHQHQNIINFRKST